MMKSIDTYSHGYQTSVLQSYQVRNVGNSAQFLIPHLQKNHIILDIGCGPASISQGLASFVPAGWVLAMDVGLETLRVGLKNSQGVENLTLLQGSVYELPLSNCSVDVVYAHQVMQHLSDVPQALEEIKRVLKPGGVVALRDTDYSGMTWLPANNHLQQWRNLYQKIAQQNGGNPNIGPQLSVFCEDTGLIDVTNSSSDWHYQGESALWWGRVWQTRVLASDYYIQALAYQLADEEQLQQLSKAWREWGEMSDAQFTMTHHEVMAKKPNKQK